MEYRNIPVTIAPDEELLCTYDIIEVGRFKQHFLITCRGQDLHLDTDLIYIKGDMPVEWQEPVIAKLRTLIKANEHPDGP